MTEFGFTNYHAGSAYPEDRGKHRIGRGPDQRTGHGSGHQDLTTITGQKPIITRARKSIAGFKLRAGNPIGTCVTLRGARMYHFLDRLINTALAPYPGLPRHFQAWFRRAR